MLEKSGGNEKPCRCRFVIGSSTAHVGDRHSRRARPLYPLRKEPPQIPAMPHPEHLFDIAPIRVSTHMLCDQILEIGPEGRIPDLAAQHMKDHGGLLIPDGVILFIRFLSELGDRIVLIRFHVDGIAKQHEPALVTGLRFIARQFMIVIVGQVRRQPFHPVPAVHAIVDTIADP